jgi:hypothetical protein
MSLPRRMSGIGLFALGLLISLTLIILALWPDLEANYYGFTQLTTTRLKGLHCPILMAADEHAPITVRLTNTSGYKTNISLRAVISTPGESSQEKAQLVSFEPGQTRTVSWPLSAEDAVFHNFILARVYSGGAYPMPPAEGSCGVYVLNLRGVSGQAVYWTLLVIGVALLVSGGFLLEPPAEKTPPGPARPTSRQRGRLAGARLGLVVFALLGLFLSYTGAWMLATLCLAAIVLILFGMLLIVTSK